MNWFLLQRQYDVAPQGFAQQVERDPSYRVVLTKREQITAEDFIAIAYRLSLLFESAYGKSDVELTQDLPIPKLPATIRENDKHYIFLACCNIEIAPLTLMTKGAISLLAESSVLTLRVSPESPQHDAWATLLWQSEFPWSLLIQAKGKTVESLLSDQLLTDELPREALMVPLF